MEVAVKQEENVVFPEKLSPIAVPLAGRKLTKRVFKLMKKASKEKGIKRGVKEVVKAIRKGEKGVCIFAGNVSPIDVISHLPVLCEDSNIPYVFVSSKELLGTASSTKRPTSCVLINLKATSELTTVLDEIKAEIKLLTPSI